MQTTNFVEAHLGGEYASEVGSTVGSSSGRDPLSVSGSKRAPPPPRVSNEVFPRWPGASGLTGLDAYSRHKKFINDYVISYGKERVTRYVQLPSTGKTDIDVLRENHKFIRSDEDNDTGSWEARMAKKYYDKLFKEYCIANLSEYKTGKIGLRWRTQQEVFDGKGQFRCGNQVCQASEDLQSFEMNFSYKENGERKSALVKLRVCPDCAMKANYRKLKRQEKEKKKELKRARKRRHSSRSDRGPALLEQEEQRSKRRRASEGDRPRSQAAEEPSGHGDWQTMVSKSTGKTYWYNTATGATQWNPPAASAAESRASSPTSSVSSTSSEEEEEEADGACGGVGGGSSAEASAREIWANKPKELTQDQDEHEDYFQGLFM